MWPLAVDIKGLKKCTIGLIQKQANRALDSNKNCHAWDIQYWPKMYMVKFVQVAQSGNCEIRETCQIWQRILADSARFSKR